MHLRLYCGWFYFATVVVVLVAACSVCRNACMQSLLHVWAHSPPCVWHCTCVRLPSPGACAQPQKARGSPEFNSTAFYVQTIFEKKPIQRKKRDSNPQNLSIYIAFYLLISEPCKAKELIYLYAYPMDKGNRVVKTRGMGWGCREEGEEGEGEISIRLSTIF